MTNQTLAVTIFGLILLGTLLTDTEALKYCSRKSIPIQNNDYAIISIDQRDGNGLEKLNSDVILTIEDGAIRFKGCNHNSAKIDMNPETGEYSVGMFISTKMFCMNDQDSIVVDAITNGNKIQKIDTTSLKIYGKDEEVLLLAEKK